MHVSLHVSDPRLPSCPQTPLAEQEGPTVGTVATFELMSSKDLAYQMTIYDWELFNCVHEVRATPQGALAVPWQ